MQQQQNLGQKNWHVLSNNKKNRVIVNLDYEMQEIYTSIDIFHLKICDPS